MKTDRQTDRQLLKFSVWYVLFVLEIISVPQEKPPFLKNVEPWDIFLKESKRYNDVIV